MLYCIGGSPCSGKSTVAERLSKFGFPQNGQTQQNRQTHNYGQTHNNGLVYFKADDHMFPGMEWALKKGCPECVKYFEMSVDEIWLREPFEQFLAEREIWRELFPYINSKLLETSAENPEYDIIAEGAAFMPSLAEAYGVDPSKYVCLVPTKEFQREKYALRTWVSQILEGVSDKQRAFENWMKRDELFAEAMFCLLYTSPSPRD